jgi:AMP nucleosidase
MPKPVTSAAASAAPSAPPVSRPTAKGLKTRKQIVTNWLPRYTGVPIEELGDHILLTNFQHYVKVFAQRHRVPVKGKDKPMSNATAGRITIINFGMGSATAATVMDLLTALKPKAVLFLGKCGGLKHRAAIGDLILPIAAIRGEGTSNDYFPPEVPALPSFALQKAISTSVREFERDYWTGTVYTTNRRVWEHDGKFKKYLRKLRPIAIDMETATIFMTGFYNEIATGALLLVSDQPMLPEGVKTAESDEQVDQKFVKDHIRIGIDSLNQLINQGLTIKHLKF